MWHFWDTQEEIDQLLNSLNVKGIKQKSLHRAITNLIDQGTLFFDSKQKEKIQKKLEEKLKRQQEEQKKKLQLKMQKSASQQVIADNSESLEIESQQTDEINGDQPQSHQNLLNKPSEDSDQEIKL